MAQQRGGLAFRNPVKQEGWAQIYHVLTLDHDLSDGAFRLYVLLLKYARRTEGCWPGRERLARDLGLSVATVKRRIAELVERGLITREQRGLGKTAMTWIEDLEAIYAVDNSSRVKNDPASPVKNDPALAGSKMTHKQETEEETDMYGGGNNTNIAITKTLLIGFGVSRTVAERLAGRCSLDQVRGWIAYTNRTDGLRSPVGFLVSKLQAGEPVPTGGRGDRSERGDWREDSEERRRRYAEWGR